MTKKLFFNDSLKSINLLPLRFSLLIIVSFPNGNSLFKNFKKEIIHNESYLWTSQIRISFYARY